MAAADPAAVQALPKVRRHGALKSLTSRYSIMAWIGALWLIVWFVIPILWIVLDLARSAEFQDTLSLTPSARTVYQTVFRNTFKFAAVVTILSLIFGYIVAYFLLSVRPRLRLFLIGLVLIPYWVSIIIRTYGFMVTLGRNGIVNSSLIQAGLIDDPLRMMFTTKAVYLGMVQVLLPYVVLSVYSSLDAIDKNLLTVAKSLGANSWGVFRRVTLPLSLPGVYAGGVIVFILSLGFYVTPALVGGAGDMMLAQLVYLNATQYGKFGVAILLVLPLIVLTMIIFVVFNRFIGIEKVLSVQSGNKGT